MKNLNVLVSLITEDNDYQLEQAVSAQTAGLKVGASVEIIYAGNDAVRQTQQILTYVQDPAKRPDAILVEPVGTGMPQIAKAAVSAGIAWGVINTEVDYISDLRQHSMVPIFGLLSDHTQIGRIQGQQISSIIEQGCVLHIEGPSVRDVARMRTQGMRETKPPTVDVKTLKGDWTQKSGYNAVKSWLSLSTSKQLHIGLIACQNDDMAIGARRALEEISNPQERDNLLSLPIIGCDGLPRSGQAWVKQKRLAATVVSPPIMGSALELLASSLQKGSQPPERTIVAPSSFPTLKELTDLYKRASGASASS